MKIQWTRRKNLIGLVIVSIIWMVFFYTFTDNLLHSYDVPEINIKSFLGKDYWFYQLFSFFTVIPTISFVIASYELIKDVITDKDE